MTAFEVRLDAFKGPAETLLDLIESKKMSITDLHLAAVTGDFVRYMEALPNTAPPRLLADFLVVAAQLLLIKSRVLIPALALSREEEEGIENLENRLRRLTVIRRYGAHLRALWEGGLHSFSRPLFAGQPVIFYPAPNITRTSLPGILRGLLTTLARGARETAQISSSLISLEKKVEEIIARLDDAAHRGSIMFSRLTAKKAREEIVVLFLALLHLLQERLVHAEQEAHFSNIVVRKIETRGMKRHVKKSF